MKKTMKYLSVSSLILAAVTIQASELGEIHNYNEIIQPAERDGIIDVTVSGVTNDQGILYLPNYEDSSLSAYSALNGKLEQDPEVMSVHGREVLAYQFSKPNNEVLLQQTLLVKDVYKTKKAKIKYSQPGGVKRISYEFINTSPVMIAKYSGQFSVPKKTELYGVITPEWSKKKKTFEIKRDGDWKIVEVKRKKVSPGDDVTFKIRTYAPSLVIKWVLWSMVLLLSAALLWKRRDVVMGLSEETSAEKATAS
mgnify:FL=1